MLRVFGCQAWAHIPEQNRSKLDEQALPTVYIGVTNGSKAFKLLNLRMKAILSSWNATFDKELFPFKE